MKFQPDTLRVKTTLSTPPQRGWVRPDELKAVGYTYDPVTDRYIYNSKLGEFNINYPVILTPKEYEELVLRESMRNYFIRCLTK